MRLEVVKWTHGPPIARNPLARELSKRDTSPRAGGVGCADDNVIGRGGAFHSAIQRPSTVPPNEDRRRMQETAREGGMMDRLIWKGNAAAGHAVDGILGRITAWLPR